MHRPIYQNIVYSLSLINEVKAKNKNNDNQWDEFYLRSVYKAIRAMREQMASGSDYLKNNNERPRMKRLDQGLKYFWDTIWYEPSSISGNFCNWDFIRIYVFLITIDAVFRLGKSEWRIWFSSLISRNKSRVIFSCLDCKVSSPEIRSASVCVCSG